MDDDREYRRHGYRYGMFGFPYGRMIFLIIIGIVLILWGISEFLGINLWHYIWPVIAVILGIMIILGAIFSQRRRY